MKSSPPRALPVEAQTSLGVLEDVYLCERLDARLKDRANAIRQGSELLESLPFLVMKDMGGFRSERTESLHCRVNFIGQTLSELVY
jgi:hypothetical protein